MLDEVRVVTGDNNFLFLDAMRSCGVHPILSSYSIIQ